MVNNNRVKKLNKEQPSLTIYPFSIDELKEPKLFPKAIDKHEKITTEIQTVKSFGKNTQNENIKRTLTETQQESKQIVKQMFWFNSFFSVNCSSQFLISSVFCTLFSVSFIKN